ncbi:MAG: molybdopterin-guanine dinucleotide biosynthesis protein B [Candidatus Scalinduaceae bacterium]
MMIFGIYGLRNAGKTTLLESLTRELVNDGYKVATVKYATVNISIDKKGKDSWRHKEAGAIGVCVSGKNETAFIMEAVSGFGDIISTLQNLSHPDVILVEGCEIQDVPKIAVGDVEEREGTIFRYNNNLPEIKTYIKESIEVEKIYSKLPKTNCEKCGYNCEEMSKLIMQGHKTLKDCKSLSDKPIYVTVNGEEVIMAKFAKDLMAHTIFGTLSALKGINEIDEVRIMIKKHEAWNEDKIVSFKPVDTGLTH